MSNQNRVNDGGPAFPLPIPGEDLRQQGMSLRAYFAGQFLASRVWENCPERSAAKAAVQYADALIAELNRETK